MKQIAMALAAATMGIASAPASAAVLATGTTAANATKASVTLLPFGSDGSFASGSTDIVASAPRNAVRYFSIAYTFTAPITGSGLFNFVTTSSGNAALKVLGFSSGGTELGYTSTTSVTNNVTTTNFSGVAPITLTQGASQTFTVLGSIIGTGQISSTLSFAAAVPETATWLMMIVGFGMIGTALRVRRRQVRFQIA